MDPQQEYEAKWAEYQDVMHRGAWRIGWGFFGVTVGFLPLMWFFIWMVGAASWEQTLFHAPLLMWVAVPLSLVVVVACVLHLYRKNVELDRTKGVYLSELKGLRSRLPRQAEAPLKCEEMDMDSFRDDL